MSILEEAKLALLRRYLPKDPDIICSIVDHPKRMKHDSTERCLIAELVVNALRDEDELV